MLQDNPPSTAKVYNIPAALPFLESFARGLLHRFENDVLALRQVKVLLPTRRACRNLRNAFLRINDGAPFILPQLIPIGDLDEDELKLSAIAIGKIDDILAIKPAISPLRRRLLLAQLVQRIPNHQTRPEQAVALADSLARLIDNVHNEDLSFDALSKLVAEEFAEHWQITLDFLEIIRVHWPAILAEEGCLDPADRRNRLIKLLIQIWSDTPPQHSVIAAGITGSLPSTAALLNAVANLPRGEVILPGLDTHMDSASWESLDDTHPQSVFHKLLRVMGLSYKDVALWGECTHSDNRPAHIENRFVLASEMMRPAETCGQWAQISAPHNSVLKARLGAALDDIHLITAKTEQEEAEKISLILRKTLQDPKKTAIVVTPDRALARRIGAAMRRWDIQLDDSAGTPMHYTRIGSWLQTCAAFMVERLRPLHFLNFMHHQLAACGMEDKHIANMASFFDLHIMRGAAPQSGFDGLKTRIDAKRKRDVEEDKKRETISDEMANKCHEFIDMLAEKSAPFYDLVESGKHDFVDWLNAHITVAESLAAQPEKSGAERLWSGEDGEEIALFLSELKRQVYNLPKIDGESYLAILVQLMRALSVRPLYGTHPRLQILGQLEARMIHADVMILAGLNEGTWPADPGHDPWMSRPMRSEFGLPPLEQSIGQAAHDFVQCFTAPQLYFSRADRKDGAPTVSSRWLLRLNAVMQAMDRDIEELRFDDVNHWHDALMAQDSAALQGPCARPEPRPPASARPKNLAVTSIGKWMRDPYSIYARYILRLNKLRPIEEDASVLDQGQFLHKVLEEFEKAHPDVMPGDAETKILALAEQIKADWPEAQNIPSFWWPRLERGLNWFINHETNWRKAGNRPWQIETTGQILWHGFTLRATADRIDNTPHGDKIIIDYKTGGAPAPKDMHAGFEPQLPLEAVILKHKGFSDKADQTSDVQFWRITGGTPPAEIKSMHKDVERFIDDAEDGFTKLIKAFESEQTPYYSLPDPSAAPDISWQDYAHLARVGEWELNDSAPQSMGGEVNDAAE